MGRRVRERAEDQKPRHPLVERLEKKRKELGLSMERFAVEKLKVTFHTYQRWLHKRFNPKLETLERIEKVLNEENGSKGPNETTNPS